MYNRYVYNLASQFTSVTGQSTTWIYDGAGNQTRDGTTGVTATYGDRRQVTQLGSTANEHFGTGNTDRLSAGSTTLISSALGLTADSVQYAIVSVVVQLADSK